MNLIEVINILKTFYANNSHDAIYWSRERNYGLMTLIIGNRALTVSDTWLHLDMTGERGGLKFTHENLKAFWIDGSIEKGFMLHIQWDDLGTIDSKLNILVHVDEKISDKHYFVFPSEAKRHYMRTGHRI